MKFLLSVEYVDIKVYKYILRSECRYIALDMSKELQNLFNHTTKSP